MSQTTSSPPTPEVDSSHSSSSNQNIITAAKGGGIAFIGKLFNYGSSLIFSIIIGRLLGAEQFGLYSLALSVTGFLAIFSYLGMTSGIARYVSIAYAEKDDAKIWGTIQLGIGIPILLSILMTIVLFIAGDYVSNTIFEEPALLPVLQIVTLSIPFMAFTRLLAVVAQGFKQLQYEVYTLDVSFNVIKLVLTVLLLIVGFGVTGVAASYLVGWVIAFFMFLYFVHRLFPLNRPVNSADRNIQELYGFALPLYLSKLIGSFGGRLETLALGIFGVVADVGVYTAILRVSEVGNLFFASLRRISVPVISELYSQGKYDELKTYYQTITKWSITFNLPIFLTIVLFGRPLLSIFGSDFTVGEFGLIILASGNLFHAATGVCGVVINMSGYSKLSLVNSIIYLISTIILDLLLIPQYQLLGAAWAGALTVILNNILRLIQVYFIIPGLLPFNKSLIKPLFAGLVAVGFTYLLTLNVLIDFPFWQFLILAPTMAIIYIGMIWALKLSDEDQLILDKMLVRFKLKRK